MARDDSGTRHDAPSGQNTGSDAAAAASETTPLLAESVAPAGDAHTAATATAVDTADSSSSSSTPRLDPTGDDNDHDSDSDKPLPRLQIALLCYARLVEPVAFFSIFPYVNQMVQANGRLADADVGFYSGLIESLFSLTQMLVMLPWGLAADRLGRKPVLVCSLAGVAASTALFGLATSLWQMVALRCLAGVFAGTVVTIRTMVAEHSTPRTQARAFSWFAFAGNLGIFLGPLLGGALADPAGQYPRVFGGVRFLEEYPYVLSGAVVGLIGASTVVTTALFVDETLVGRPSSSRPKDTNGAEAEAEERGEGGGSTSSDAAAAPAPSSTWDLLSRTPGVASVLYNYGHVMLLAFAYTAVVPVFWFTPVRLGGLGFSPLQISLFMGLTGLSQAVWLLLVFPPLQRRLGTNGVLRLCGLAYPFFLGGMPVLNLILRQGSHAAVVVFFVVLSVALVVGPGVSMAFTGVQLALNDVSPSPRQLGMLNALALTITSGLRSFSPVLFSSLFAIGAQNQFLLGYLVWIVLFALALGFTVSTRFLPAASEKKPAEPAARRDARDHGSESTVASEE
ncbi:MFS general substrate transporter [Xylariaceae sp. FL0804]|nr:MFS general substrate transporter [Xylariaceae sp. FL0804]